MHILILLSIPWFFSKEKAEAEEDDIIQVVECPIEENGKIASEAMEAVVNNSEATAAIPIVKSSNKGRRFDSVRGLLEKVRHKLMTTKQSWRRSLSRSRAQSQDGRPSEQPLPPVTAPAGGPRVEVSKKELKQKDLLAVPPLPSTMPSAAASDLGSQSQSSPNTPAQLRKEKRHRSFSPVR